MFIELSHYQCRVLKYKVVCVFSIILEKGSVNLAFIPVFKPHSHTLHILRHCTDISDAQMNIFELSSSPRLLFSWLVCTLLQWLCTIRMWSLSSYVQLLYMSTLLFYLCKKPKTVECIDWNRYKWNEMTLFSLYKKIILNTFCLFYSNMFPDNLIVSCYTGVSNFIFKINLLPTSVTLYKACKGNVYHLT